MTGQELFAALSFVDARYIAEADVVTLRRSTPWMKVLSVAACLCILITGVYAYSRMQSKGAMESMQECEAAAPAAPAEAPAATEAAPRQESETEAADPESAQIVAGELQHIPYAELRILHVTEDGFEAEVEAVSDEPNALEVGIQVKLVVDSAKVPGADREIQNDLSKLVADICIQIEDGAYDAGTNTLYAAEVFFTEGE